MKDIDVKIAESEAIWRRYRYENMGVRESLGLFCGALKRSLGKRIGNALGTACTDMKRASFKPSYDRNKVNTVVSLTSTKGRLSNIFPTLYSLTAQTRKPDLIVLWLGKNGAYQGNLISRIRSMGIRVCFREDLGPHTKYYYAFREYKNDLVITVDDDIIYHRNMVDELYGTCQKHRDCVIARRVNRMRFDQGKRLLKYKDWIWEYRDADAPAHDLLATGVGAVLYPPLVIALICREDKDFLKVSPRADDIWLKFRELSKGVKVCAVYDSRFDHDIINRKSQRTSLASANVDGGKNDLWIRNCMKYFGMTHDLCERVLGQRGDV